MPEFLYSLLGTPLGYVMWILYLAVNNFGLAVILFTLLVKVASFPLSLKQQKNMAVTQLFTPRVQEIQKKYRNNQQKMQEEMTKLQKEGYNPMGGCGPMLLSFILLFGILDVVYKPMTHMEHFDQTEQGSTANVLELGIQTEYTAIVLSRGADEQLFLEFIDSGETDAGFFSKSDDTPQVTDEEDAEVLDVNGISVTNTQREKIGKYIFDHYDVLTGKDSRLSEQVKSAVKSAKSKYSGLQRELYSVLQFSRSPDAFSSLSSQITEKLSRLEKNMIFLGINLGETPRFSAFDSLWLIAIFCFVCSVLQMAIQQYIQKRTTPNMPNAGSMKFMMLIGPVFSLFIVFAVPAGAGLYWAVSYLFMIAQSLIIYKFWPPEKMREEAKARFKAKNSAIDITAKVMDTDDDGNEVVRTEKLSDMSAKEQKEYYRKKLEEARKADLEKYGEVPDVDLSQYDKPDPAAEETDGAENEKPNNKGGN